MNLKLIKSFKEKLNKNVLGVFSKSSDSSIIEILGLSGFDFIILDKEHGYISDENLKNHIRSAELANMVPIVRISNNKSENISKVLDLGAYGIQIPNINKKQDIDEVIKFARFFPNGKRGVCKYVRSAKYSDVSRNNYFELSNMSLIIAQVEGKEGLENINEILEVKGIDVLFIGPYDLSQALGVTGDVNNPKVLKAIDKIINKAKSEKVKIGIFCDTVEEAIKWKKTGVNYISCSVDYGLIRNVSKDLINKFKNEK